ncbi:hypothetical protein [Haloferax sp. Atlit-12N]|uniref:hypothetical protein n=1 Tax=Haloferax sp. Atlit-12N TaxID=2077203 RepID=UPI0011E5D47B|nr:hypothetical protein [Haloferax sp. Atlit-12N]
MSECDCPLEGDSYATATPDACNETDETGDFMCSKPAGHDGPHAACNVVEHPSKVWGEDDV